MTFAGQTRGGSGSALFADEPTVRSNCGNDEVMPSWNKAL